MKRFSVVLVLLLAAGLSAACQKHPQMVFGVPQNEWQQLTPEQKDSIIASYNERKTLEQAIKAARDIISDVE